LIPAIFRDDIVGFLEFPDIARPTFGKSTAFSLKTKISRFFYAPLAGFIFVDKSTSFHIMKYPLGELTHAFGVFFTLVRFHYGFSQK
jgi:hypothetical protein